MSGNVVVLGHVERYLDESSDRRERFVNLSANWPLHVIGNNRLGPVKMDVAGVWDWDIPWSLNIGSRTGVDVFLEFPLVRVERERHSVAYLLSSLTT